MFRPIWLDEIFQRGGGDPVQTLATFRNDPRIERAFRNAATAYAESMEYHKQHPNLIGVPPEQAARSRFLDELLD